MHYPRVFLAIGLSALFADVVGAVGGTLTEIAYVAAHEVGPTAKVLSEVGGIIIITVPVMMGLGAPTVVIAATFLLTPMHFVLSWLKAAWLPFYLLGGIAGGIASLLVYSPFYTGIFFEKNFPMICGACLAGGVAGGFIYWKVAVKWPA